MEVQELHDKLAEKGVFLLPDEVAIIKEDVKKINGCVRDHKWNIRGLWAVLIASWSVFLIWLKNHL